MFSILIKRHAAILAINPFDKNLIPDDASIGPVFGV